MDTPKQEHFEDVTAHEWCQTLLSDPTITRITNRTVEKKRKDVSNSLLDQTLFTDNAVRAYITLYRAAKLKRNLGAAPLADGRTHDDKIALQREIQDAKEDRTWDVKDPDMAEITTLVSLGDGIDGGVSRLHGGVTATLLDQAMGKLISHVYETTCATSELRVKYKKAVVTPCVMRCRAKIVREKGRWTEMVAWMEDGEGVVYAEAWGGFVQYKAGTSKL